MSAHSLYRNILAALLSFSLVLGAVNTLDAQTPLASISGVVTDSSGGVIPGVKITAKDTERGQSYHVLTNGAGVYTIPDLLPSNYEITAAKTGFKTYVVHSFPLITLQKAVMNITLSVGSVTQSVNVASRVQMIEPSKATLSGLVNNAEVQALPLATRNVLTLMATLPGVTPSNPNSYQTSFFTSAARYSINGGMESTSAFELDGVPIVNQSNDAGILGVSVMPSLASIQDVKVQTSDYSAAYGPSGGGITTMTTKSGTNAIHGDVYEFLQNNALDANGFFSNRSGGKIPPIHYDDYGFSLGGPIVKNHTFGFFAFERNLSHEGTFGLFTVPTQLERNGNFSQDFNSAGQLRVIYNPFSTTPNPASPGTYIRTPFPGNIITPSKLLDPVGLKAASYYPAPNLPGLPFTHTLNLGLTAVTSSPVQLTDFRVDHNFSESKRGFVRYDYSREVYGDANLFGNPADEGGGTMTATGNNAVLGYTQTFGSGTVLDLRAGLNRFVASRPTQGYGFDLTSLGLPSSLVAYAAVGNEPQFPGFSIEGYSMLGQNDGGYYNSANTDYIFSGHLSHVAGKQILTGGADSIFYLLNFFQVNPFVANFSNDMTQGPNPLTVSSTSGDGFASFLLGTGDSGNIGDSPQPATASHYFAQYIEDDIKWTPKFTINLGFRLEEQTTTTERYNRLTAINPLVLNPVSKDVGFNVYGGFVFAGNGPDSLGRRNIAPMQVNPNPRIGIAYMLNNNTVIRAGYGIFYGIPSDGAVNAFTGSSIFGTSSAFSTSTPWLATLDGITPNNLLSDPFPQGYVYPQGSAPGLLSGVGTSLASGWPQTLKTMYNQQWNFTVQRSFGNNYLLQLSYVGNKATHLGMQSPAMNQLLPSDMSQGNALLNLVTNPFYGYVQPGTLDQPTVQQGQLERPFPEWETVTPIWDALGNSEYDAWQVLFQKRFTHGNSFSASYVWSKTMADAFSGYWNGIGPIRSWYCISCEHSVANFDVPQRFVLSWVAALPFGSGQAFGSNWRGIKNVVLGGWQANGILTLASGMPLVFSTAQNTTHSFGGGQHPNLTGVSPFPAKQSINEWFNPAAFAQPANFTFGNLGMTYTPIRQDWTRDLDFSLFKNFSLTERFKLQLRGEAFNITNTPIFGAPDTAVGSSSFGVIGYQANSPRVVQLALKLLF